LEKSPFRALGRIRARRARAEAATATVKSIELAAFVDQAAIDYVLAVRVLHVSSIIMTHAVRECGRSSKGLAVLRNQRHVPEALLDRVGVGVYLKVSNPQALRDLLPVHARSFSV
jgi:hypothetical protein